MGQRPFLLPDVGEGLTEADLLTWKVAIGDAVSLNQPLCDIETAKAVVELPSPFEGIIHSLGAAPGDTVAVGAVLVIIDDPSFTDGGVPSGPSVPEATPAPRQAVLVGYGVATDDTPMRQHRRQRTGPTSTSAAPTVVRTTPPVRLLAKQLGISLRDVVGTGPDGLITRHDVERMSHGATSEPSRALSTHVSTWADGPREERVALRGVAKAMADAMTRSKQTIPHATVWVRADVTRTADLVAGLRERPSLGSVKVSPLVVIALAVTDTLRQFPGVNACFDDVTNEVILKRYVHLGIAADTPRGLLVPNIKHAEELDAVSMATAISDLVATARAGTTTPAAMQQGTFTITNVGPLGVDGAAAVIPPGTGAILAVGAMTKSPWVDGTDLVVRDVMELSLSFDHRIIDGALASRFLRTLADTLTDPAPVLLAP
jgi:pyruvate dehydrogenase E2 component (dihydrolipoamide acetyltransferase)